MNESTLEFDAEVLIVGGGPVGFGLALDLAMRDVQVKVIERHETIQRIPKGQNLTQRTGEHFRRWGVTEAIRTATPIPAEFGNAGMTAYGSLLSGYHHDWFNRASVAAFYAATNERLPQYETERVLRDRAAEFDNIEVLTGWTFTELMQLTSGVEIQIQQTEGDQVQHLRAKFLIGTDGANSAVRRAAGIELETTPGHRQRMALLVFNSSQLDLLLEPFKGKTIYNALGKEMQGYWQFLGRVDLDGNWFFHAPIPDDATVDNFDFQSLVHDAVGKPFDIEFEYIGLWDLRLSVAESYQNGRVFIAGDAAHSHPPYGGYGVNTGFEDARNLSWKLAAALDGWAGSELLESYTLERKPIFESTRDDFILRMINEDAHAVSDFDPDKDLQSFLAYWQKRSSGEDVDVTQYLPQISGSPCILPEVYAPCGARGEHMHKARAGYHLSPLELEPGKNIYDCLGQTVFGECFTLIVIGEEGNCVEKFEYCADNIGLPMRTVRTELSEQTALWDAKLILVRPDEYVAWCLSGDSSSNAVDAEKVLLTAIGQPH